MRKIIALVIILILAVVILWPRSTSGNTENQSYPYPLTFENNTSLPTDICIHDDMPVIYDDSFDPHGYYSFSYMNKDGVILTLQYVDNDIFNPGYHLSKYLFQQGGKCVP